MKFRKRIKVAPGVTMNLSHKSIGTTVGGKYARVSANTRRGVTTSQSIPGTGLYATQKVGGTTQRSQASTIPADTTPKKRRIWMPLVGIPTCMLLGAAVNPAFILVGIVWLIWAAGRTIVRRIRS